MEKLKIFIQLTRLMKPIGFMLLFWPCAWGLTLAYYYSGDKILYISHLLLFFLGSVLMRSAGCIVNDIADRDLDKKVRRTKNRPLAADKISVLNASAYVIFLCLAALLILIQFNWLTVILGMGSMILAFSYPYMKRITYWPQLFLGLTFNWGIIMGWTSITNEITAVIIILYIAAIFWTLGYDTIYGLQDIKDDEIIGTKSTAIKFKHNIKFFVSASYCLCVFFILIMFLMLEINKYLFLLSVPFIISLAYQVKMFRMNNSKSCFDAFKLNNLSGFLIFVFILSFNIL